MLSSQKIRLVLLGPPIIVVFFLIGCFNKNSDVKNYKRSNMHKKRGDIMKKNMQGNQKCEKCGEVRKNCKCRK